MEDVKFQRNFKKYLENNFKMIKKCEMAIRKGWIRDSCILQHFEDDVFNDEGNIEK